jgi:hypothetical protein
MRTDYIENAVSGTAAQKDRAGNLSGAAQGRGGEGAGEPESENKIGISGKCG